MNIDYKGVELEVDYSYSPAHFSLDHYTPNEPEEAEILSIKISEIDAYDLLEDSVSDIECLILDKLNRY